MNTTNLVDAGKLAKRFNVTVATVNTWVREGRIPYIRASRKVVRFVLADVETALSHKLPERAESQQETSNAQEP